MRSATLLVFVGLLAVLGSCEPTEVSYIVDVEEQARQDFLSVIFSTNAESESLVDAIEQARSEAQNLRDQAEEICLNLIKDNKVCKQAVEIGKVDIEPSYKEEKRETLFQKITVTYEVVITWKEVKLFGAFVDQLLLVEGIIIQKIQWTPDEDLEESHFLEESIGKSADLCAELGKKFIKVVAVEELRDEPEVPEPEPPAEQGQEEQEEELQEQPQEQQEELDSYKITILCDGKADSKKKKTK